jgi:hypothetical protein
VQFSLLISFKTSKITVGPLPLSLTAAHVFTFLVQVFQICAGYKTKN